MSVFPDNIQFRRPWRSYQQRVLSELSAYLDDNHLHVIAAPGSGKTVLGLEVMRRLNQPTLIFAPSVAIRDQWVDRLIHLFSDHGPAMPDWVSRDIRHPKLLTVSTYQGLHSVYTGQAERKPNEPDDKTQPARDKKGQASARYVGRETLLAQLRRLNIRTLVLDEAHHLRNEWWRCLVDLKQRLDGPTVVALTATAPFDVSPFEWDRYVDLCGPIDAEIGVPELVREENLCAHQDYVYLSSPLRAEQEEIRDFRREVDDYVKALCGNEALVRALESHPCVSAPRDHVEDILADPGFYSSIAFFLNHVRHRPPRQLLRVLGLGPRRCPKLNAEWLEILLAGCLYAHARSFQRHKDVFAAMARDLKRIGAIERRAVNLRSTSRIARLLTRSVSKLKSIEDIVAIESESLQSDLRMVILTDFIRRADFPKDPADIKPVKRLGVVPIFEYIRRNRTRDVRPGILTGTLTVIPSDAREQLQVIALEQGIDPVGISTRALAHDEQFCEVFLRGADKQKIVKLITSLFAQGGVTVLVGTTALLGEGWDAPSVNALILASFVGSYMLSNQMRGRAIRTQEGNPAKTANIWHPVCQETGVAEAGEDMDTLARRFKAFVGVSFTSTAIQSGLGRLGFGRPPYDAERIDQINAAMAKRARDRDALRARWERALDASRAGAMVEEITASPRVLPRAAVRTNAIVAFLGQAGFWGLSGLALLARSSDTASGRMVLSGALLLLAAASGLAALAAMGTFLKATWRALWHVRAVSSMRQVGKALAKALGQAGLIETRMSRLRVVARRQDFGFVSCSLKGGTTRERSIFLDALGEVLGPMADPRYVLIRKPPLRWFMRRDVRAVPTVLSRNKDLADPVRKMWARHVEPCDLVYTRNVEGRQLLLKGRAGTLSAGSEKRTERTRSWK